MTIATDKKQGIQKFANESPCVCFNIRKASRIITQVYDGMFKDVGLTATQAIILGSLRMLGAMTISELAEALATDRTTLTRNLKPLERDGLISSYSGEDKRAREVVITKKGEAKSVQAFEIFKKFQEKLQDKMGKEKIEDLCKDICFCMDQIQEM